MYASHPPGVETALKVGGRYRVLTTFPDATELVEEFNAVSEDLECRRWRSCRRPFGGMTGWEYEIGDDPGPQQEEQRQARAILCPSSLNPSFHPRDNRKAWEWHVRNLPYPEDTYKLGVDNEKQTLVLRTTNKKYFKVFKVPALIRAGLPLQQSSLRKAHDGKKSTLIISYAKPEAIIEGERKTRAGARSATSASLQSNGLGGCGGGGGIRESLGSGNGAAVDDNPPGCKQS